jgi:hypothetical protein
VYSIIENVHLIFDTYAKGLANATCPISVYFLKLSGPSNLIHFGHVFLFPIIFYGGWRGFKFRSANAVVSVMNSSILWDISASFYWLGHRCVVLFFLGFLWMRSQIRCCSNLNDIVKSSTTSISAIVFFLSIIIKYTVIDRV